MNNPFNITFGKIQKNTMISRDDELKSIYNSFNSEEPNSKSISYQVLEALVRLLQ